MRHARRFAFVGFAILLCCIFSVFYSLRAARSSNSGSLNGQEKPLDVQMPALRLESWGECFQSAPGLLVAVASLQADSVGRERLRRNWRKWRVGHRTAQLLFFLRSSEAANREVTIDEFHANQDLIIDSHLTRQDDLTMLQASTAWFIERCPRTPWLLFAQHGALVNPRRVLLHATGGVANGVAPHLPVGLAGPLADATTKPGGAATPRCLLLSKRTAGLVKRWPTTWSEMLSIKGFNSSVRDATPLLCSSDGGSRADPSRKVREV